MPPEMFGKGRCTPLRMRISAAETPSQGSHCDPAHSLRAPTSIAVAFSAAGHRAVMRIYADSIALFPLGFA